MTDNEAPSGARLAIVELLRRSGEMPETDIIVALAHTHGLRVRIVQNCLKVLSRQRVLTERRGVSDTRYGATGRTPSVYSLTEARHA